jgi:hypothetical protein
MGKFRRSWLLFKSSVSVMVRHKRLLVFPIVTAVLTAVIALFFLAPMVLLPTGYSFTQAGHWNALSHSLFRHSPGGAATVTGAGAIYLVFLYFGSMFLATFFNVAFYNEILAALSGQPVSIRRGLSFAGTKLMPILVWTLFAGLVGLIIKALEERLNFLGRIIARLVGLAWSIAAIFAIPVIVREGHTTNPLHILRSSASKLKRTWGEALIGYVGLTFGNFLVGIGSVLLLGGAAVVSIALENYWIIAFTGLVWLLGMIVLAYVTSVASQIYKGALYLYASEGVIAEPYNKEMLDQAWKTKRD